MFKSCIKGSIVPMVAVALTVILLILLLVIDLNSAQTSQARLQSSTDSASLDAADYIFRSRIKEIEKDPSVDFKTWLPNAKELKAYVVSNLTANFEGDQSNSKLNANSISVSTKLQDEYTDVRVYGCATLSKNFNIVSSKPKDQEVCADSTSRIEGYGLKNMEIAIALDSSYIMGHPDAIKDFRGIWTGKSYKYTRPKNGVGLLKKFLSPNSKMREDNVLLSLIPYTTQMNIYPYADKFIDNYRNESEFSLYNMMSQYPVFDDADFQQFTSTNGLKNYKFRSTYDDLRYQKDGTFTRGKIFETAFPEYNLCKKNSNTCPAGYESEKPKWDAAYVCPTTTAAGSYYTNWPEGTYPGNYPCADHPLKECQARNCYFYQNNCGSDVEECREMYLSDPTNHGISRWAIEGSGSWDTGALYIKACEFNVVKQYFHDMAKKINIQPLTYNYDLVYNFFDNFAPVSLEHDADYKHADNQKAPGYLEPILKKAPESIKDRYFRVLADPYNRFAEAHNGYLWAWQTISQQSRGKWNSPSVYETEQGITTDRTAYPRDSGAVKKVILVFGTLGSNNMFRAEFKRHYAECDSYTQFADKNMNVFKRMSYSLFDEDPFSNKTMKESNATFAKLCEKIRDEKIDIYYIHYGSLLQSDFEQKFKNQMLSCTGEGRLIEVEVGINSLYNAVAAILNDYAKYSAGIRLVE